MCVDRKIRERGAGRVAQLLGRITRLCHFTYRSRFKDTGGSRDTQDTHGTRGPVPVPVKRHRGSTGTRIWFALGFYHKPLKRPGCGVWAASLLFVVSKCP